MKLENILKQELKEVSIQDSELKKLRKISSGFIKKFSKLGIKTYVGGSFAKGTLVKKNIQDIDIFAVFDSEQEIKNFEKKLKKSKIDFRIIHGSRDYFHIMEEGVLLEIVPILKMQKNQNPCNVTDFSLSHVKYVKSKLKKNHHLANEIKLAKVFCHAQKCYGAESYIKGFSGYCLELLICYYGSFAKFLRAVVNSKKRIVIDIEKQFKKESNIFNEINESKLVSPIIIVDPCYKYRNVCAGLSNETFERFIKVSKEFLKHPSAEFFKEKEIDLNIFKRYAKRHRARFVIINLNTNKQKGDIAGTKMKKFFDFIISELERKEQNVLMKRFDYFDEQDAKGYIIIKEKNLIEIKGPPIGMNHYTEKFKKFRGNVYVKSGILYAQEKISIEKIFESLKKYEKNMHVDFYISYQ